MNFRTTLTLLLLVSFTNNFTAAADLAIETGKKYRIKTGVAKLPEGASVGDIIKIEKTCKEAWGFENAVDMTKDQIGFLRISEYMAACQQQGLGFSLLTRAIVSHNLEELIDPRYHGSFLYGYNYTAGQKYRDNEMPANMHTSLDLMAQSYDVCVHARWLEGPIED